MGIFCRAMSDCKSCLSINARHCIWQQNSNSRYPCRAGFFDVETSDHLIFITNSDECERNIPYVGTDSVHGVEAQTESNLAVIIGISTTIFAVLILVWYFAYVKLGQGFSTKHSHCNMQQDIELLPLTKAEIQDGEL